MKTTFEFSFPSTAMEKITPPTRRECHEIFESFPLPGQPFRPSEDPTQLEARMQLFEDLTKGLNEIMLDENKYDQEYRETAKAIANGLAEGAAEMRPAYEKLPNRTKNFCNVCGSISTKQCSVCRSVYYCSVKCQRKDWKTHKRHCKAAPKKNKAKSNLVGPKLESMSDKLLVHIGTAVGQFCGVRDYLSLMGTSKRFHRLLSNEASQSLLIEKENERIFGHVFASDDIDMIMKDTPITLQELMLCQSLANAKPHGFVNNRFYVKRVGDNYLQDENGEHTRNLTIALGYILMTNPSVMAILDAHCPDGIPRNDRNKTTELIAETFRERFEQGFQCLVDEKCLARMKSQMLVRPWGYWVAETSIDCKDTHGSNLRKGMGWLEISFRIRNNMGGFEVPSRPEYYHMEERFFLEHLKQSSLVGDHIFGLEAILVELRLNGSTSFGELADSILFDILRARSEAERKNPSHIFLEAAKGNSRGLLLEIVVRAMLAGSEWIRYMDMTAGGIVDFLVVGRLKYGKKLGGHGRFADQLVLDIAKAENLGPYPGIKL